MVASVPLDQGLLLAAVLFALGLAGVLVRRNLLFMLMSLEVMLNATGIAFIVAGARWSAPDGQIMFILVLTFAAAEVSVGLALILLMHRGIPTLDADAGDHLRG
jgi:NADH-quinone oxidoreductase subunit K